MNECAYGSGRVASVGLVCRTQDAGWSESVVPTKSSGMSKLRFVGPRSLQ